MAKSNKTPVLAINPPNSGLMAWLNQSDTLASESATEGIKPKEENTPDQVEDSKTVIPAETQALPTAESVTETPVEGVSQSSELDDSIKGDKVTLSVEAVASAPRKPKSRVGEGSKSGSYSETFFKKPVKAEEGNMVNDVKPVRISEDAHWLLSVMVGEARRQGHKLNMSDLIDNLLSDHRSVYKNEVDELISKWKARKRFD